MQMPLPSTPMVEVISLLSFLLSVWSDTLCLHILTCHKYRSNQVWIQREAYTDIQINVLVMLRHMPFNLTFDKLWSLVKISNHDILATFSYTFVTHLLITHLLIRSSFVKISSKPSNFQTIRARDLNFWVNVHHPLSIVHQSFSIVFLSD